ncbi:MAG TPA: serine/threonine-protein kinase [Fibrobacteria bacterium]|nr:serine/threonine-protein kinase [Fibrobacteria bacterium]
MDKATFKHTGPEAFTEHRFGGYTIVEHLGKGGMGDVYRAVQAGLDRVVALKILPSLLARSTEFSERFFTEAYAISRLQHQNIVTIYDYGDEGGQKFIAMQYIQGTTLSKLIQGEKKLDYERIIAITKQICRGLKYAHQNEIVHRDIKSGNIMVEPGDKVFISDFGIAKVIDAPSITTTGMAMGTPEYMAPEQCEGGVVDGQSDIYGLGIIIYEMVTGRPPFLADTPLAVAYKQVHETPPLLGKKASDVPPRLELIVAKCLKKNKAERYRNADDLLKDLDSAHFDVAPEMATAKSQVPSDLRITDRRGKDRRYVGEPMALSRGYLWGILGLFAIVLGALAFLLLRPASGSGEALRWMVPRTFSGPAAESGPGGPARVADLFDGKRSTAWTAPAGKEEMEVEFAFAGKVLVAGLVIEAGYQSADGAAAAYANPKSVVLEAEGRRPLRLSLSESDGAQYLALGGVLLEKGRLRFSSGSAAAAAPAPARPMAVREVRFLGLPYE